MKQPWTEEEDAKLKDLNAAGVGAYRTSLLLNKGDKVVRRRLRELGLSATRSCKLFSPEDDDELANLRARGLKLSEIAAIVGRPESSISRRLTTMSRTQRRIRQGECVDTHGEDYTAQDLKFQKRMRAIYPQLERKVTA